MHVLGPIYKKLYSLVFYTLLAGRTLYSNILFLTLRLIYFILFFLVSVAFGENREYNAIQ